MSEGYRIVDTEDFEEVNEAPRKRIPIIDMDDGEEESVVESSEEENVDDNRLEYAQAVRESIVTALSPAGVIPVHDLKAIDRILSAVDGIEKQVFGKKRLKQIDKTNQNDQKIAEMLERAQLAAERKGTIYVTAKDRPSDALNPGHLPVPELLPNEMDDAVDQITSADFFKKMEDDHPELRRGSGVSE